MSVKPEIRNCLRAVFSLIFVSVMNLSQCSTLTQAATYYWDVSSGNWSDPTCWGGKEPTSSDDAYIRKGGIATINETGEICNSLFLGTTTQTGTVQQRSGGGLTVSNSSYVGYYGTGTFTQYSGKTTISSSLYLGWAPASIGSYYLNSLLGAVTATNEYVGYSGTGTFALVGGTNTITNNLDIGYASGSNGTYNVQDMGQLYASYENVGISGTGTITQTAGWNTISSNLCLGYNVGSSGTYNLTNGTLTLKSISKGAGTAAFNFGKGTLRASDALSITLPMKLTGNGGNANIDSAGYAVTLAGVLSGSGGLAKLGSGTLTLSSVNTFSGSVEFNGGFIRAASLNNLGAGVILNFNSGGLQFSGVYDPSVRQMTFLAGGATLDTQTNNVTLSNSIGNKGTGGLTKLGSGTLTLSGVNTFSGPVNFNGGFISATSLSNLGTSTLLYFNGGGLCFNGVYDPSVRSMKLQAGGATLDTLTNNITLLNPIGGGDVGSLTKLGSGTLTFIAKNAYGGDTIIKGGKLEVAGGILTSTVGTKLIDVQEGAAIFKTVNVNKSNLNINTAALTTFEVVDGVHVVGAISGKGITQVDSNARLTASSIAQGALTIGSGAVVTIQPIAGGPLSGQITAVPEPSSFVTLVGAFMLWACKRKVRD
jgi:fibronectin-binding autotransporter adhesin